MLKRILTGTTTEVDFYQCIFYLVMAFLAGAAIALGVR